MDALAADGRRAFAAIFSRRASATIRIRSRAPTAMRLRHIGALPIWTGPWNSGLESRGARQPQGQRSCWGHGKRPNSSSISAKASTRPTRAAPSRLSNPADGSQVAPIPLLVKSRGAEIGARTKFIDGLDSTHQLLVAEFRLGKPVRGRHRHDDVRPAEPALWHRTHQSLTSDNWLQFRRRSRAQPCALARLGSRRKRSPMRRSAHAGHDRLISPISATRRAITSRRRRRSSPRSGLKSARRPAGSARSNIASRRAYPLTEDGYFKAPGDRLARSARRLSLGERVEAPDRRLQPAQFEIGPNHLCLRFAAADRPALRALPEPASRRPPSARSAKWIVIQTDGAHRRARDAQRSAVGRCFRPNPRPPTQRRVAAQGFPGPGRRSDRRRRRSARKGGKSAQQKRTALRRANSSRVVWALCWLERRSGLRRR